MKPEPLKTLIELETFPKLLLDHALKIDNKHALGNFSFRITWTSADEKTRPLNKMTDSHIQNLSKCCPRYGWYRTKKIVDCEIRRRHTGSLGNMLRLCKAYVKRPETWQLDIRIDFHTSN